MIFEKSIKDRDYVKDYFLRYKWSSKKSYHIEILPICFCMNNILIDKSTCNSGFTIIGSKEKLNRISHCFYLLHLTDKILVKYHHKK